MDAIELFKTFVSEISEVPDLFSEAVGYSLAGAIVGRRVQIFKGYPLYPNLWAVVVGESGWTRKSTLLRWAMELLEVLHVGPRDLDGLRYLPYYPGSAESLIDELLSLIHI